MQHAKQTATYPTGLSKQCSMCGAWKSIHCFNRSTKTKDGFLQRCRDCDRLKRSAWQVRAGLKHL